ncbi:prepilin-type N-terminal cleavage/methylation domain-containing protein [Marinospirillum sp.]|uniref:prepilin-type N-terminal cleavage/methylation domain-containing protein n=1 Tax=Marinospirillum sp. TaxID=2183934 RepID=UPI002870049B|nr:prepilin-type N-terminal cleavage/methylation domain-containing protein [Marinospirillum sp.]MDR9466826.1 prepilin-type N-terminal cleavage/methylation domain-containing protein [Marinospirillum sp.]
MKRKTSGFTLLEMLLVSALGSLLLLAATQIFASLVHQQAEESVWLRLEERARLTELVLKQDLASGYQLLEAGAASRDYPKLSETDTQLSDPDIQKRNFASFRSSDWLLINRQPQGETPDYSLWHVDEKTYGKGLAHKISSQDKAETLTNSQTLVAQVELLRLRFFSPDSSSWIKAEDFSDPLEEVTAIQFAALVVSGQALDGKQASHSITLWGETLNPPDDGHLRTLVLGRANLREPTP